MRKLMISAVAVAALLVPSAAWADDNGKATGGVQAAGSFADGFMPFNLDFTAQDPLAPMGNVKVAFADGSWYFVGALECYSQVGNQAGFAGEVTKASSRLYLGSTAYVSVVANGEGDTALGPDWVQLDFGGQYASNCSPGQFGFPYEVTGGNLMVHQG